MSKHRVFYSFYFDRDFWRVQQIRNMGVIEGNEPAEPNKWETIKRTGDSAIKKWIDDNMQYRSCVIVLVGSKTSERKYVQYEIKKAWGEGKGLFGIYIHNLEDQYGKTDIKGKNPFNMTYLGLNGALLSSYISCYDPGVDVSTSKDTYQYIKKYMAQWIEKAISEAKQRQ